MDHSDFPRSTGPPFGVRPYGHPSPGRGPHGQCRPPGFLVGPPAFLQQTFPTCPPYYAGAPSGLHARVPVRGTAFATKGQARRAHTPHCWGRDFDAGCGSRHTGSLSVWACGFASGSLSLVGSVSPFVDLLRPGPLPPALGPRYVSLGFSHVRSFTYGLLSSAAHPFGHAPKVSAEPGASDSGGGVRSHCRPFHKERAVGLGARALPASRSRSRGYIGDGVFGEEKMADVSSAIQLAEDVCTVLERSLSSGHRRLSQMPAAGQPEPPVARR